MRNKIRVLVSAGQTIRKEIFRKSIHITIALVPTLASINFLLTVVALTTGILFYIANETARVNGKATGIISRMTVMASRSTEHGFVWGPVTLGLGALAALLYYPEPAAVVAIYALAFGDGIASLVGKLMGKSRILLFGRKTLAGSLSCFVAVLLSSWFVLDDWFLALMAAVTATLLELIPIRDLDNLIIPLGTGMIVTLLL